MNKIIETFVQHGFSRREFLKVDNFTYFFKNSVTKKTPPKPCEAWFAKLKNWT